MSTVHNENQNNTTATEQNQNQLLDLSRVLESFLKFWWVCVILAVLAAGILFYRSYVHFTPVYQSSVTFTVQTQQGGSGNMGITSYSFSYNRSTASQLSNSFPNIIRSNILQDIICNDLGLSYFPCSLSASSVSGTNMFTITATGYDPQVTYDILQSVIKNYPVVAQYVIGNTDLHILTEPVISSVPSNQFAYRSNIVKGLAIGFALGMVWVLIYAFLRQTVRSPGDVKHLLNQNCLGVLPVVTFKKHNKEINRSVLLTNHLIGDAYLESFRTLRNSLLNLPKKHQVIMVTSVAPGEGKTSVSINLALSLAMMNKKVIIIDADMRNPNVGSRFGLKSDDVSSESSKEGKISRLHIKSSISLSVLNFNSSVHSMWKFLEIDYLTSLLEQLRSHYDYIIIDTSPLGITSEPAVVAQVADAAVVVIKPDTIRTSRIISIMDTLQTSGVEILGCILNGMQTGISGYGYGYGKHYGRYGYGYGYSYGYGFGSSYGYSNHTHGKGVFSRKKKHLKSSSADN